MKRLVSIIISLILLLGATSVKAETITAAKEVTTVTTTTVNSYKVTYITLQEYGSKVVTNYISADVNIISLDNTYSTITNIIINCYSDAELTNLTGWIIQGGWIWNIEEVTTTIETTTTTTEEYTTTEYTIIVNTIEAINNNITVNNYDSIVYILRSENSVNNYNVDLEILRTAKNREYKTASIEDG